MEKVVCLESGCKVFVSTLKTRYVGKKYPFVTPAFIYCVCSK